MEQKIKKAVVGILVVVTVLFIGVTSIFSYGKNFVDTNGDNICDNAKSECPYRGLDNNDISNNDSICHNRHGKNYVDANGDNICDNYKTRQGRGFGGRFNK